MTSLGINLIEMEEKKHDGEKKAESRERHLSSSTATQSNNHDNVISF